MVIVVEELDDLCERLMMLWCWLLVAARLRVPKADGRSDPVLRRWTAPVLVVETMLFGLVDCVEGEDRPAGLPAPGGCRGRRQAFDFPDRVGSVDGCRGSGLEDPSL